MYVDGFQHYTPGGGKGCPTEAPVAIDVLEAGEASCHAMR